MRSLSSGLIASVAAIRSLRGLNAANVDSQKALEASERPWVSIEPTISLPLTFNDDGTATATVDEKLENLGHSVAVRVMTYVSLLPDPAVLTPATLFPALQKRDEGCARLSRLGPPSSEQLISGQVLFPGKSLDLGGDQFTLTKEQLSKALDLRELVKPYRALSYPCPPTAKVIMVELAGCVVYYAAFDDPRDAPVHSTKFMYCYATSGGKYLDNVCTSGTPPGGVLVPLPWGFLAD